MNFLKRAFTSPRASYKTLFPVPLGSGRAFSNGSAVPKSSTGLWAKYLESLEKRPLTTKAITSGILTFGADMICQLVFPDDAHIAKTRGIREAEEKEKDIKFGVLDEFKLRTSMMDWKRTVIFSTIGVCYIGPVLHFWYGYLMTAFSGTGMAVTLKRLFLDQALFAPMLIAGIFANGCILEGRPEHIPEKLRKDWPPTIVANVTVWVPAM